MAKADPIPSAEVQQVPPQPGETMVRLSDVQAMIDRASAQQRDASDRAVSEALSRQQAAFTASLEALKPLIQAAVEQKPVMIPPPVNMAEKTEAKLAQLQRDLEARDAWLLEGAYRFELSKPEERRMTRIVGADGLNELQARMVAIGKYQEYFGIVSQDPKRQIVATLLPSAPPPDKLPLVA